MNYALWRLAQLRHRITLPLASAAAAIVRTRAWVDLGYVNEHAFAREFLDTSAKTLRNLAALDEAMKKYPALARAVAGTDGDHPIGRYAARRVGKLATPETIEAWIDRARRMKVRDLDALIRDAASGASRDGSEPTAQVGRQPGEQTHGQTNEQTSDGTGVAGGAGGASDPDVLFRIQLPPEVRMASDETTDLHRAIAGHDATRTCFIEDLLAEVAASGVWAPDPDRSPTGRFRPVRRGLRIPLHQPTTPHRFATQRDRDAWPTHTTEGRLATRLLESFARDLRDLARITRHLRAVGEEASNSGGTTEGVPQSRILQKRSVTRILRRLLRQENEIELRMGGLLLEQHERRAWPAFGCASLDEYVERLGWSGASARRRMDVARGLRRLRVVRRAYESGRVTLARTEWIVRETRRGTLSEPEQQTWVAHTEEIQNKRLRDESRILARQRLEHRAATARATTLRHRSDTLHRAANAKGAAGNCFPVPPDDAAWLRSIARVPGQARNHLLDLEGALLERVLMRGAMLEEPVLFSIPESLADDFHDCLTRLCRRLRQEAVEAKSAAEEARTLLSVRIAAAYLERGTHMPLWVGLLAAFEICVLEWDEPRRKGASRPLQRRVLERDGYRCTVPGCTARRNLQVNHIQERSHGGPDAVWNLHAVCAAHHLQFIHAGRASVRGRAPGQLAWRIGRPEVAQWFVNERRIRSAI